MLTFFFAGSFILGMDQLSWSNSISTQGITDDQAPLPLWLNSQSFSTSDGSFLLQLVFWHQCSPTQQLMTSLGLPHPFSNASPPKPPPLPAVPACNPDLISSYLSHHSKTSCLNLCLGSFLWSPLILLESPLLSDLGSPLNICTFSRIFRNQRTTQKGEWLLSPRLPPAPQWGGFHAWVVYCLSVSDFAAPEAMALSLQAQGSLGSQQIINNTLVTPPATC